MSGDRATHLLTQKRRARPLRALDRARQTQILSPRRPPGPGSSPYSEARVTGGHRETSTGFTVPYPPGKAGAPSPCVNDHAMPKLGFSAAARPLQGTAFHCPGRPAAQALLPGGCVLPRADALLATGPRKELTETGRAGAAPRARRRDPGHLPHGRTAAHHPRTAPQAAPDRLPELPG